MALSINRDYLINTLTDLVRINSVNPSLVEDGRSEAEIGRYVASTLRDLGMAVTIHEAKPQRPSIVGILKGNGSGRSLMLNGHMDTVGVKGMSNPFIPTIHDGNLSGRGAYDMKGSLAACLTAAECTRPNRMSCTCATFMGRPKYMSAQCRQAQTQNTFTFIINCMLDIMNLLPARWNPCFCTLTRYSIASCMNL